MVTTKSASLLLKGTKYLTDWEDGFKAGFLQQKKKKK